MQMLVVLRELLKDLYLLHVHQEFLQQLSPPPKIDAVEGGDLPVPSQKVDPQALKEPQLEPVLLNALKPRPRLSLSETAVGLFFAFEQA